MARVPDWHPDEVPMIPGSPASVRHAPILRLAYLMVGILVTITGGLGSALVSVNLPQIQGELGLTPVEGAWLTAAYTMVNLSANLLLFKARQQFGIRPFAEVALVAYLAITAVHLFVHDYPTALLVRGVAGFVGAPLTSLGLYYVMQAFPKAKLGNGVAVALGLTQISTPLAWLLSPSLLDLGNWQALYLFEFALTLCSLAAVVALKLPPGMRVKVIERTDVLTFLLCAPAFALIAAVLSLGRLQWWTEQPWMGWALVAALGLLILAFLVEHHRANPMIQTRWIGTSEVARFVLAALLVKLVLSEQSYAANGLLRMLGVGPDQFGPFYLVVILGMVTGITMAGLTFGPRAMRPMTLASIAMIFIASLIDGAATSDTRPQNMMVSQFLVGMAAAMILAPLIMHAVTAALKRGPDHIITFAILFAMTQNGGALLGPALYGTIQQYREYAYSGQITGHVDPTEPVVAQRLAIQRQLYARVVTDPARRDAQGTALLQQIATREANVRAYNDVFRLNAIVALFFLLWSLWPAIAAIRPRRRASPVASGAARPL